MLQRNSTFTILLGNIILFAGLAFMAYLGFYNRYWADDWCYSADARNMGTINATLQYFNTEGTGYSSNRYSLTFFSAITENILGMFGNQIFATLTIALWLFGITWTLHNISRLTQKLPFYIIFFISTFLLYYNLYISPQKFQILYWRSGVLPYSTALIFWMIMLGFITAQMNREMPAKWFNYVVAPIAFLASGLGEISATLLFSGTSILLFTVWLAKIKKQAWAEKTFQTTFITWLFLLIGMLVLIISPSNIRLGEMGVKQTPLLQVPALSIRHAIDFITISLRTLPIPHFIFMGTFFSLAILSTTSTSASTLTFKRLLLLVAFTSLITFILITAIQAPSGYFYSATPDPRGKSLARYILLIGLGLIAWFSGIWTAQKINLKYLTIASVLFLLLSSAYTARSIFNIYNNELRGFIFRAEQWDERDAHIESEKALGKTQIEVIAIDTADIDIRDIFVTRGKGWTEFVQNCASRYYQVDGLKVED
jgi:hypothetical protein